MNERIAKRLARAGICSRREAERLIEAGRVAVDGLKLTTPAVTVTEENRITGAEELPVNSAHHQAVKNPAPGLVVDAVAPDGVIEGIEDQHGRFLIGVQWHPEYGISEGDKRLFAAFIEACQR